VDGPTLLFDHFVEGGYPLLAPAMAAWTVSSFKEQCRTDVALVGRRNAVAAAERVGDRQRVQTSHRHLAQSSTDLHPARRANGRMHDTRPGAPHAGSQRRIDVTVLALGAALLGRGGPAGEPLMTVHRIDDGRPGALLTFHHVDAGLARNDQGALYLMVADELELVHDAVARTVRTPPHLGFGTGPGQGAQTECPEEP